jgi:chemosensory pili system protein ChpA (sensor histidine kinase/response regulator)
MVGLTDLGELAYKVEAIHNRLLEEEHPVTPAVIAMIGVAEAQFRGWIATLKDSGHVVADPKKLMDAVAAVEAELSSEGEPTAEQQVALVAAPASMIELQEVGGIPAEAPAAAWLDSTESGDEGTDVIDVAPAHTAEAATPEREALAPPQPVTIGDVTLTADLFAVLVDEAEGHVATLAHELSVLQFDSTQVPSAAMVRASHTLCGIHRTSGLQLIALTAQGLEQCLLALQRISPPLPASVLPVLADAIACLRDLVTRVKSRSAFTAADSTKALEIQLELDRLKRETTTEPVPIDAEAQAAHEFVASEEAAHDAVTSDEVARDEPATATAASAEPSTVGDEAQKAIARAGSLRGAKVPPPAIVPLAPPAPAPISPPASSAGRACRGGTKRGANHRTMRLPTSATTSTSRCCRSFSRKLPSSIRRPASRCVDGGVRRAMRAALGSCSVRCTRSRGSARMAGAMRLGELAHRMESRLAPGDAPVTPSPELFEALDTDLDRIGYVLDALRQGKMNVVLPDAAEAQTGAPIAATPLAEAASTAAPATPEADERVVVPISAAHAPAQVPAPTAAEVETGAHAMLRVRADIIDRLVNEAGEVAITRARIESELRALKANLLELTGSVVRLRSQVREFEIQAESQIQSRLSKVGEATRSSTAGIRSLHPLPGACSLACRRCQRRLDNPAVAAAQSRCDRCGAHFAGASFARRRAAALLDSHRSVRQPHGTPLPDTPPDGEGARQTREPRDRRRADGARPLGAGEAGRSARTSVAQRARPWHRAAQRTQEIGQIGDGRDHAHRPAGWQRDRDRARRRRRGPRPRPHSSEGDRAGPLQGRRQALRRAADCLHLRAGIQHRVEGHAGVRARIGMDVVRSEIAELGGRVEVSTRPGKGTTFMLYLPLTLAVAQTVLVRAGGRLWALPAPMVEKVEQTKPEALVELYVQRRVVWQGLTYPFHYLPRLLGDRDQIPESTRTNAVLLLRSGQSLAAIHVDEMIGNQEVVVKNIGPQLARVSGIAGATVLGTGEIVLIINPVQLAQRTDVPAFEPTPSASRPKYRERPSCSRASRW